MKTIALLSRFLLPALLFFALSKTGIAQWAPSYIGTQVQGGSPMTWNVSVVDGNVVWASMTRNYAAGFSNDFFRTVDGGSTWEHKVVTGAQPTDVFVNLHALNADTAWAILWCWPTISLYPKKSRIYKTSDGGDTWVEKDFPLTADSSGVIAIHFFNDSEGFAYAQAKDTADWYIKCYYTQDGGNNWHSATVPEAFGEAIFVDWGNTHYSVIGDTAWFGGARSKIYRTIDKGMNWDTFPIPYYHARTTNSVSFSDARNGIAATMLSDSLGAIYPGATYAFVEGFRTRDGGLTWERLPITKTSTLNRAFRLLGVAVIPGSGGAYMAYGYRQAGLLYQQLISWDEGESWSFMTAPPYSRIRCMQFLSPTVGWAGGWQYNNTGGIFPEIFKWTGPALTDSKERQLPEMQLELSPNPATDYLNVVIDAEPGEVFQLQLIDIAGKVLRHVEIQGGIPVSLDLHTLNKGVCLVKVFNEKGTVVGKLIKL